MPPPISSGSGQTTVTTDPTIQALLNAANQLKTLTQHPMFQTCGNVTLQAAPNTEKPNYLPPIPEEFAQQPNILQAAEQSNAKNNQGTTQERGSPSSLN